VQFSSVEFSIEFNAVRVAAAAAAAAATNIQQAANGKRQPVSNG
jgi:hypothetical protein